ncbi:MAG: hypothetical protein LC623_04945 [Halobacteriales archaeon]|nr:hypothetical protein [Halobacteriales archaeon]
MSFRRLAVPLALLAFVPLAHAQVLDDVTLTVGAIDGLAKDDGQDVVAYKGNATVEVTVKVGCAAILDAMANGRDLLDHVDVAPVDPPAWLVAESHDVPMDPSACITDAGTGSGYLTLTDEFPFSVAASAPGVVTQSLNLTASLENGAESAPVQVLFAVQFHSDYDVVPSVAFPYTVTGKTANFTVSVTNRANARSMVMVEEQHVSTGTFSGLGSTVYQPPETKTFQVTFKAPDRCWADAQVEFKTFSHYLLLDQRAGTYKGERQFTWDFTNGVACTPGKDDTSKKSPVGGLAVLPVLLGAALLARRRL